MSERSPEQIAAVWADLEAMAGRIGDSETRAQALAGWRARYDEEFPRWLAADDIVRLPDWKHVGEISGQERRQAAAVSSAWVDSQQPDPMDPVQARRFAWEMGRRANVGFIDHLEAEQLCVDRLGSAATAKGTMAAFRRGFEGLDGEALLAAIVVDLRCARLDRNEAGLAQRFHQRHGHNLRYTTAKGWMMWDGKRWKVLADESNALPAEILRAAYDTVAAIQREAAAMEATGIAPGSIPDGADPELLKVETAAGKVFLAALEDHPDGIDGLALTASTCRLSSLALSRFGHSNGELKRYRALVEIAKQWLTIDIDAFDTDPLTINCQNGTLRLIRHVERGISGDREVRVEIAVKPHDRADLLTKVAAVPYDPDAICPNYDFTVDWAQPDPAMRRYIHQWGGYNLTGDMGAQIFHMWWGPSAQNGKSTLLDAWADAAGDYSAAGKIETFMEASARSGDAATPALAVLPGVRMLRVGEPPANAKFDESLINTITGQDTLLIRALHRGFYPVKLDFKLTVACNERPTIPNATEGIKRRVKVVMFEKSMKDAVKPDGTPLRDPNFKEKLVPELPGIFARLIEGACDWLRHGFIEPGSVTEWTDEYKDENDPLGRFMAYCTEPAPGDRIQSSKLYQLFVAWSKATGGPEWSQPHFSKKMKGKGYSSKASNGMQWLGIKAVREVSEFVDGDGVVRDLSGGGSAAPPSPAPPPDLGEGGIADWPDDDLDPFKP
jgi:DNA primase